MDKIGHMYVGITVGILFIVITNLMLGWFDTEPETILICLLIILIYCLIPDIDTKSGTIVWWFIPASIVGMMVGYFSNNQPLMLGSFGLLLVTFLSATFFKHRGFTHTIAFGIMISLPLIYLFSYQEALLSFLCFYSHLGADDEWFQVI